MLPEPDYTSVETYEVSIFKAALQEGNFTVARGSDVREFEDFASAAVNAFYEPRALVYAVTKQGRSVVCVRTRWSEFLKMQKAHMKGR